MTSPALRKERIGIGHTAQLLGVRVTELKDALRHGRDLRGHPPPQPIVRGAGSSGTQMLFLLGDVMDVAELMANP
ncbi:hypothetical protein [Halomonas sp. BM-2019]|uniref:hypothetical protein n=1 Tax=Halomonas sp. BM-2019 TaxID=2811227 RepID=UPI001B3C1C1C|nr:MAG: hypothetical protein J5F18_03420 [Halomonas sp. BM-2019]